MRGALAPSLVLALASACGGRAGDVAGTDAGPDVAVDAGPDAPPPDPSDDVFDPDAIHDISLELPAADWADIDNHPQAETWHTATYIWDGELVEDVGVRAFGYSSHVVGKPPLKIDFDHVVRHQEWRGLEQIKLRNAYYDASFMHDALAPWMLRRAGVPASRTGWARVWANGTFVGFYTVMESIDDRFLQRTYGNDNGPLYSIDGIRGHGLMPITEPLRYFQFNTSVTGDGADLVDITRIVASGTDEELARVLDLDNFFDESIVRTLTGSQDAFSADGNNFYLYNDPGRDLDPGDLHGTWHVIPWDYNFDFTAFGTQAALTVEPRRPWETSGYAFDPTTGLPYHDAVMIRQLASGRDPDARARELVSGPLAYADVEARVLSWRTLIADEVARDPIGGADRFAAGVLNDLQYIRMRWSNTLGHDAVPCTPLEPGAVLVHDMAPAGTVGWATLTVDGWAWNGDGHCLVAGHDCFGFDVGSRHFCTGLFAHAASDVTITVPAGMTKLRGAVGLQRFGQDCSNGVGFAVRQDGALLWQSGVLRSYTEAEDLGDVAVHPGAVELVADPMGDISCDMATWVDLRAVP
ncbi:MAG TPA: CotH kinase family protein [Kofleriaceae bacterium]|nr:CotH kinase family protein [Kofleriaceae bacterium]